MTLLNQISGLTQEERKIAGLKYQKNPFGGMTPEDRVVWAKNLLLKIHVITGWAIPQSEFLAVLIDQFEKKMNESYPSVNPDEVEFAFRNASVKEWGKQLNILLIDEAMQPYLEKRALVSKMEEQQKSKLMLPETKEDISDEGMDKFWDDTEKLVGKGNYQLELIPPMLYDWMDKNGNILFTRDQKIEYMERATLLRHGVIAKNYEKNPYSLETKAALVEFNNMRETKVYTASEYLIIKEMAKRMVVFDMMKCKTSKI